jgi:hypothetical protein
MSVFLKQLLAFRAKVGLLGHGSRFIFASNRFALPCFWIRQNGNHYADKGPKNTKTKGGRFGVGANYPSTNKYTSLHA